jgi:hypothetical protein
MDDIDWWYVGKDGEKTGPASIDVLEGLWLAGELDGLSLVWREGLADYIPVAESELRNYFQGLDGEDDEDVPDAVTSDQQKEETATRSEVKEASTMWSARDLWERQWAAAPSELGKEYYANLYTQESSWEPPNQPKVWIKRSGVLVIMWWTHSNALKSAFFRNGTKLLPPWYVPHGCCAGLQQEIHFG